MSDGRQLLLQMKVGFIVTFQRLNHRVVSGWVPKGGLPLKTT